MVALMEQLLSSLKSIYSHKIMKKLLGQDLISFEYIAHEQEILFYIVCPKNYMPNELHGLQPLLLIKITVWCATVISV